MCYQWALVKVLFYQLFVFGKNNITLITIIEAACKESLGLEDFAIRLVFFFFFLRDGQVLFFGEIQITEGL